MAKKRVRPTIVRIEVDKIQPNSFNANRMSKTKFGEYVAEVQHLGRLPKACVVRRIDPSTNGEAGVDVEYEIIDGEHGWRAAQKLKMKLIDCEVVEADDFESRRQCYKRNRSGKDDPLLRARLFEEMRKLRNLSHRRLAKELNLSEGTLRNYADYLRALEWRMAYSPETAEADIRKLTHSQVSQYLAMPHKVADKWLDAGADKEDLVRATDTYKLALLEEAGLYELLDTASTFTGAFRRSAERLFPLADWLERHGNKFGPYLRPVAEQRLPLWVLELIPCRTMGAKPSKSRRATPLIDADGIGSMLGGGSSGYVVETLITPEQWAQAVASCAGHYASGDGLRNSLSAAIRMALRDNGHDLQAVEGPAVAEKLQILEASQAFVRDAHWLSLDEQCYLATAIRKADGEPIMTAAQQTVEYFRQLRAGEREAEPVQQQVHDVFGQLLAEQVGDEEEVEYEELDDDDVLAQLIETICQSETVQSVEIDGVPGAEIIRQRLGEMEWPEVHLIDSLVGDCDLEAAVSRWLAALGG